MPKRLEEKAEAGRRRRVLKLRLRCLIDVADGVRGGGQVYLLSQVNTNII
jgi:hypothetical protein